MAFGAKTNERPGVRCEVKYVRSSAYKAREVLDLIRGLPVARALEILEFAERDIARTILKALESAIANAEHNNSIPADELYVSACFADEGPTLKRFRPRARGSAARIRKRTCHITVIVSRYSAEELTRIREREAASGRVSGGRAAAEARRERVARSRSEKAEKAAEHEHDDEVAESEVAESEVVEADAADVTESEAASGDAEAATEETEAADDAEGKDN